jgi:hypothetical protein
MTAISQAPSATTTTQRPHLSHSQIKTYAGCPRRYRLERGIGVAARAPQAPSEALAVGSAAHTALEAFGVALRENALKLTLADLRERAQAALDTELEARDPQELLTQGERREMRARLQHLMAQFYSGVLRGWLRDAADGVAVVTGVEEAFTLPLLTSDPQTGEPADTGWDFTGRVDVRRSLAQPAYGQGRQGVATEIADFKTASKPWQLGIEHLDGQASAYAWAAFAESGALPQRIVFHVVSASIFASHGGKQLYPHTRYEARVTVRTEQSIRQYQQHALTTLTRLQDDLARVAEAERVGDEQALARAFPPNPTPLCGWCGVLASCSVGQAWLKRHDRGATEVIQRHVASQPVTASRDGGVHGGVL